MNVKFYESSREYLEKKAEFNQGDKVFHETFGVGSVEEVIRISSSLMYKVDFGVNGTKAIDSTFCSLKKV